MRRYAVPKSTESHTNERAERYFIDITGPFYVTSFGGNRYAIMCVDDPNSFRFIRFLKHKNDAAKKLRKLLMEHIAPQASRSAPSAPTVEESSKANYNCS